MAYTTADLIRILDQELRAHWKGERILLSSIQRLNNSVVARALGAEKLSKVFAYRDFRSQVHAYQQEHHVSGLVERLCSFGGYSVQFPQLHNHLVAIPGDKERLMAAKDAVISFWSQASCHLDFWLAGSEPRRTTPTYVERQIVRAEWAEVDVGQQAIYLGLCWGNPEECHCGWAHPDSGCEQIIAAADEPAPIKV